MTLGEPWMRREIEQMETNVDDGLAGQATIKKISQRVKMRAQQ